MAERIISSGSAELSPEKLQCKWFEVESDGHFVDREETKELLLSYPEIQVVSGGYNNLEF